MPLREGSSPPVVSSNIRELHTGPTYAHTEGKFGKKRADKQAVAIALNVARKARGSRRRGYADGGAPIWGDIGGALPEASLPRGDVVSPMIEDYKTGVSEANQAGAGMTESGVAGMRSGDPVKMGLGAAQTIAAPLMPAMAPIAGVTNAAIKAAGRVGPGMEHAADVASWFVPGENEIRAAAMIPGAAKVTAKAAKAAKASSAVDEVEKVLDAERAAKAPEPAVQPAAPPPPAGGLSFPPEESADRLRLKLAREQKAQTAGTELPGAPANDRMVVRAPEGPTLPHGKPLPDFATGKITPQDWVQRHEQILSPEEIQSASKWYDTIHGEFLKHTGGDEEKANKYMRAWLVGQQNVDVSGAMQNMLLQREQVLRGVPEDQMKAAGMPNPTIAARRVMQDRPIEGGVGQKISDFVDAAEGKKTRSWMGNKPEGGDPFVVDVHTARDTGMVDQELVNHLTRLGYEPEQIAALKKDLGTSPSETQYENRAKFGRELTQHLNDIKWQGRNDWTPKEVQAVGWMGMTRLTANKAEDVATGLRSNMRHISAEVAPGEGSPWAEKYGTQFSALPPDKQAEVTRAMTDDAVKRASDIAGVDVRDIVHGTGGWNNVQNPSTVAQTFASKQGADIAANALGHLLQQTEVWSTKVKPITANPKGFAVDLIANGDHNLGTDAGLRDFWSKVQDADPTKGSKSPLFQGYQPIRMPDGRIGIRVLIDRGGAGTKATLEKAVSGPINDMLKALPDGQSFSTALHEAEITKAGNDWKADKNGESYTRRLVDLVGPDRAASLGAHGAELEERFKQHLDAARGQPEAVTGGGGQAGARSLDEAQAAATRWAGGRKPLEGLPGPMKIGEDHFVPGPIGKVQDVAEQYMREHRPDVEFQRPDRVHPIDPEHSKAIAQAYEDMKHTPNDKATKASYNALIDETAKQYQAIKASGLKIEPIPLGAPDPYAANPRLAAKDVAENNHLWFFPTEGGYGTEGIKGAEKNNPMLRKTGEKIGDHEMLANDMFRVVHDYFGHLQHGHGFRAAGEDNAWRSHSAMYSDLARPAMTSETRGQNSWVNYGPHGEANRVASGADTKYADQKVGLMPDWTMRDRGEFPPQISGKPSKSGTQNRKNILKMSGGGVGLALEVARRIKRAKGGAVHVGPIIGKTGGRADEVPMEVPDGSYVLTADHCSAMGQGNTLAGFEKLKKMFPKSVAAYKAAKARGPVQRASGGRVPIYAADGEFVICPEDIKDRYGDLDHGHKVLDHWQTSDRKKHIETLSKLAPPAQD